MIIDEMRILKRFTDVKTPRSSIHIGLFITRLIVLFIKRVYHSLLDKVFLSISVYKKLKTVETSN